MKLLITTLEYPPQMGGIATYVANYSAKLSPESIVVYAPRFKDNNFVDQSEFKIYRANQLAKLIWPRWLKSVWQIGRIAKKEKIDLVHVHNVLPLGNALWLLNKFYHLPYAVILHGSDLRFATRNWFKRWMFLKICRAAESVVVNSNYMKDQLTRYFDYPDKIKIVYPCPSDNFIFSARNEAKIKSLKSHLALEGKQVILSVARLVERKGHALFVSALPKILAAVPNAVWVVVGEGPEKKNILDQVIKADLAGAVRFVAATPPAEVINYFDAADLFVLLTHTDLDGVDEAWGTVFLEAAARGVPVVAGESGGASEAVLNQETGLVVAAHNSMDVAEAVITILQDGDYAKKLGQAGRARVQAEFTWDKQIMKLIR